MEKMGKGGGGAEEKIRQPAGPAKPVHQMDVGSH